MEVEEVYALQYVKILYGLMVLFGFIVIKENINLGLNLSSLMCCKAKVEENVYNVFLSSMNILISKKKLGKYKLSKLLIGELDNITKLQNSWINKLWIFQLVWNWIRIGNLIAENYDSNCPIYMCLR